LWVESLDAGKTEAGLPAVYIVRFVIVEKKLRVAYFPDSFLEVDGVAMTSNKLVRFVKERDYPFLCVHAGPATTTREDGSVRFLSLKRSALSIPMDHSLRYDPFFQRHVSRIRKEMEDFQPDVVHITGLNDVSIAGAYLAWSMDIALVASWHTNLHEYAARRLAKRLSVLPSKWLSAFTGFVERSILKGAVEYYKMPQCILAPNDDILETLVGGTGRPAKLMVRGVDTEIFSPSKRTINDGFIRFGFVGRLRAEKNVRMLAKLERELLSAGNTNFKFLIVGEGDEREYLERNMETAEFTGYLEGEELSEAYANMDVFVFPSETDAYGNVPQEAMASGAPAIVTNLGGPRFFVRNGENGFVAENFNDFVCYAKELIDSPAKLQAMKEASIAFAATRTWESVFTTVYDGYRAAKHHLDDVKAHRPKGKRRNLLRRFGYSTLGNNRK
jgi:glycosyltransferase involved in cell wall biosynthesis